MGTHTFTQRGVTETYLSGQLSPGYSAVVSPAVPVVYLEIDLSPDDDDLAALQEAMDSAGWDYFGAEPAPAAQTIAQIVPVALAADASSIPVASGWVDVLSGAVTTKGGSSVGVQVTAVASVAIGAAQARVRVNGGAFSNQVIGAVNYDLPILSRATVAFHIPRPIPDTAPTNTEYTFTLQMQATGILGTVTPRVGTVMTLVEYR